MYCHGEKSIIEFFTEDELRDELRKRVFLVAGDLGFSMGVDILAGEWHMSKTTIWSSLANKHNISPSVVKAMGMERAELWKRKAEK